MSEEQYKLALQFPEVSLEEIEKEKYRLYKGFKLSRRLYDPIEYDNPHFDFIAYPFIFLLGLFNDKKKRIRLWAKPTIDQDLILEKVAELVGSDGNVFDLHKLREFIEREAKLIKKNTRARKALSPVSEDYVYAVLERGFAKFDEQAKDVNSFRRVLRETLPESSIPMQFSLVARFIANGDDDVSWYEDTRQVLVEHFPNHDTRLICDIFAATSIRASLKSNVTKFFKALAQLHERREREVELGKVGEKEKRMSLFEGFLDATVVILNKLADGEGLSARKIMNFSNAMYGDKRAVIADIWNQRVFDVDALYPHKGRLRSRAPTDKTYDAIEWYTQFLADFIGFEPRQISAMMWGPIRSEEDKTARDVRYDWFIKKTLDHGLFADQYGALSFTEMGLRFINKKTA